MGMKVRDIILWRMVKSFPGSRRTDNPRELGEGASIVGVRGRRLKWETSFLRLPADPDLVVWDPVDRAPWLATVLVVLIFVSGAGPNVVYVVLVTLSGVPGSVKSIATVVLAAVKTACNAVLIPRVAWMLGKHAMGATMSLREIRARAQTLGICFLLVNTFVWPLGAVMFASPVCFRDILVHRLPKTINLTYMSGCEECSNTKV